MLGWQVMEALALTAGPTYNVHPQDGRQRRHGLGWGETFERGDGWEVRFFPGFALGVQL